MDKLHQGEANYTALTPITFLRRASMVYAHRTSIIYGHTRFTWRQTYDRCRRLASSLLSLGISKSNVVSVLAPNIPAMYEMQFAVPMTGAILNNINTMLDPNAVKTILHHSEAKLVFVDYEYMPLASKALGLLKNDPSVPSLPTLVVIREPDFSTVDNRDHSRSQNFKTNELEYEQLILKGDPSFVAPKVNDEWDPIALNYTSGTTSSPKGVVYSHRGAYLNTLAMIIAWDMGTEPIYLWTLPMFHCNGWTFTWGIAARGGTNVCIRKTTSSSIYSSISLHGVTHMCCAPVVFNLIREANLYDLMHTRSSQVRILMGGAPPAPNLIKEMERLGFNVVHAYGLTEATGPALVCEWREQWDHLPSEERGRLKARQGVSVLTVDDVDVKDLKSNQSVPHDATSKGEIVLRGSGIMKGYYKNDKANSEAFEGEWFHTGDVGVIHPDGHIELKDRLKDVIISGGENISSVEVENVIFSHPKVLEVAVVAMPHPQWGESPCAFVVKKVQSDQVTEQEIIAHCRSNLSSYMVPKKVVFLKELPKTSTGKPRKEMLRIIAKKFKISETKSNENNSHQSVLMSRF